MNDVKLINTEFALKQGVTSAKNASSTEKDDPTLKLQDDAGQQVSTEAEQGVDNVEQAVANLNQYVQSVQRDLQFRLDDTSGKTVITVFDSNTDQVVRQMPDDVALRLARDLQQDQPISLFNAKV